MSALTYASAPASRLTDGPPPVYAHRLTLAQRIVNAGLVRWRFCAQEHEQTRLLRHYERSHGFTQRRSGHAAASISATCWPMIRAWIRNGGWRGNGCWKARPTGCWRSGRAAFFAPGEDQASRFFPERTAA